MTVKLAAKLPDKPELNGLDHHEAKFLQTPTGQWVAVVYLSTQKITHDYEKGDRSPTLMVDAIEIVGAAEDIPFGVRHAFDAARDRRTGGEPLFTGDDFEKALRDSVADLKANGATSITVGDHTHNLQED